VALTAKTAATGVATNVMVAARKRLAHGHVEQGRRAVAVGVGTVKGEEEEEEAG
jgi:hypothetical protein